MLEGDDDDDDNKDFIDVDGDGGPSARKLARPKDGEVRWWMTSVTFDSNRQREDVYDWADVGGGCGY